MAAPAAYGRSQAKDWIRATAAGNTGTFNPLHWTSDRTCASAALGRVINPLHHSGNSHSDFFFWIFLSF